MQEGGLLVGNVSVGPLVQGSKDARIVQFARQRCAGGTLPEDDGCVESAEPRRLSPELAVKVTECFNQHGVGLAVSIGEHSRKRDGAGCDVWLRGIAKEAVSTLGRQQFVP